MGAEIQLRAVDDSDIPIFHAQESDAESIHKAAFMPAEPATMAAFAARWERLRRNASIVRRTIVVDGNVAGHIDTFVEDGNREVSYWLGRTWWGQGIATRALALFATEIDERPLFARVATDNVASLHVLQKCGFVIYGAARGYADARGMEIDEYLLRLD